jgi:hypothetical protein
VSPETMAGGDILNDYVLFNAEDCKVGDVISITIIIEEVENMHVIERRGFTTIVLLT